MEPDILVQLGVVIPAAEITMTATRASGPGGQNVNKTSSRITLRWNVLTTEALSELQKMRVLKNLFSRLTQHGDLIIHVDTSRSQKQNRSIAIERLIAEVKKAIKVEKKRIKTKATKASQKRRVAAKAQRGDIKKLRKKIKYNDE